MKIYNLIIGCAVLVGLSACNDWLDVTPEDTVTEDELYKTGEGYRNALNGVYQQMSSSDMYGGEMSWGMVDALGRMYMVGGRSGGIPSTSAYYQILKNNNYASTKVTPIVEQMWSKTFNSIANCNNLLERIREEDPAKFRGYELEQHLIEGEALALRAILHFDMFRLFAPAPVKDDGRAYIPYFETYPLRYETRIPLQEGLERVRRDLIKAKELVAPFDTLAEHQMWMKINYRFEGCRRVGNTTDLPTDLFYAYRGYRMNYYAICAMLARVYNYSGMHAEANELAQEVIDASFEREKYFSFTPGSDMENGNRKLYNDLIFSLSNTKIFDIYEARNIVNNKSIFLLNNYPRMFDDEGDFRKKYLVTVTGSTGICNKYLNTYTGQFTDFAEDMLPMIRLSEMYYIQAEYEMEQGNAALAESKLEAVREGRNCTIGNLHIKDKNPSEVKDAFRSELIKEAHREFMSEGQVFFYYKKLGIRPSGMTSDEHFYFPLPDNELIN